MKDVITVLGVIFLALFLLTGCADAFDVDINGSCWTLNSLKMTNNGITLDVLPDLIPTDVCTGKVFNDVNAQMSGGETFCKYIEKLKRLNITSGCGNGNYCPDRPVTRGEMAVLLIKAMQQIPVLKEVKSE